MPTHEYDAVVVGSGPNGLAAAIRLQQKGLSVLLIEGKSTIGGGLRTAEITLPGFKHDICSAIHPLAAGSPYFKTLPLAQHGLNFIQPTLPLAHPFDDGSAATLSKSLTTTIKSLDQDGARYDDIVGFTAKNWNSIIPDILGPLRFPSKPGAYTRFGLNAITSATFLGKKFNSEHARGLWAGLAAHSIQPLSNLATSAIAIVLAAAAHAEGWPIPEGGSQSIADALASYFYSIGGKIETDRYIKSLNELPSSKVILLDVTPKQMLQIAGHKFSSIYKWQLQRYRYGMGVFKIDWALDDQVPFKAEACRHAGTVHIGGTFKEIVASEKQSASGNQSDKPYVLLAQQSLFDSSRAPKGKHTAWAYCHVPNGSRQDMTEIIEKQVERFAPGFRERVLAKHTMNTEQVEEYNPNYIGGDINGGIIDIGQLFTRPALRASPYRTSAKGIYCCSSSTPPGGGVHGMCGYHAAGRALKDIFGITD